TRFDFCHHVGHGQCSPGKGGEAQRARDDAGCCRAETTATQIAHLKESPPIDRLALLDDRAAAIRVPRSHSLERSSAAPIAAAPRRMRSSTRAAAVAGMRSLRARRILYVRCALANAIKPPARAKRARLRCVRPATTTPASAPAATRPTISFGATRLGTLGTL